MTVRSLERDRTISFENSSLQKRPLVVGEVLFDHFPDGRQVLGGAPFNVAWNLQALGLAPLFVSAVGRDDEATTILQKMDEHGLATSAIQINDYPTGKVIVDFADGEPSYEIVTEQAYDQLSDALLPPLDDEKIDFIYHGSLIMRSEQSRAAVLRLRQELGAWVFVDLNVREPWFEIDQLGSWLTNVDALKLNSTELELLAQKKLATTAAKHSAAQELLEQYLIETLWVTCGKDGAHFFKRDGSSSFAPAVQPAKLIDTVGAGDAFSAAVINGLARQHGAEQILGDAVAFAARVCELRGATTDRVDFYHPSRN